MGYGSNLKQLYIHIRSAVTKSKDFPLRNFLPPHLEEKCLKQNWSGLEVKDGLKEGRGVFSKKVFKKNEVICNYGGTFLNRAYVEKNVLPFDDKCKFLLEIKDLFKGKREFFYLNHDDNSCATFGKLFNHSQIHPNLNLRVFVTKETKLEVIFCAKCTIKCGDELVWDYGNSYEGLRVCVESCRKCRKDGK